MTLIEKCKVPANGKFKLSDINPEDTAGLDKETAKDRTEEFKAKLAEYQYRVYAENKQSLLVILQALDAAGKDGVVNHIISVMNPQGCRVQSFKVPSTLEAAHDFLWRAHLAVPKQGEVVVFNRSYYESVLVERVHSFAPRKEIEARYGFINDFERLLQHRGTQIVKIFLHISKEEQLSRFIKRLDDPEKNWKISASDYSERALWDDYTDAFERVFAKCSTDAAPWFVIPANKKWFRDYAVSEILLEYMKRMDPKIPAPHVDLEEIRKLADAELAQCESKKIK